MNKTDDFIIENGVLKNYVGPGGDVVIPDNIITIDDMAFSDCESLTTITIQNGVTTIGNGAFRGCENLTAINIPGSITIIGDYAFNGCNRLTGISIPQSVTTIGGGAFWGCKRMTTVTIQDGVATIGNEAFRDCESLTSITIPASVKNVGVWAFNCCKKLITVNILDGVTTIDEGAFSGCKNLTTVNIPNSVTSLGAYAFGGCKSLSKLTLSVSAGVFVTKQFSYSEKLRINIPDIAALPTKFKICAALCFAEDGADATDPRYESHIKYLKTNTGKIIEAAVQNIPLLTLICREHCIKAKNVQDYLAAVQKTGDAERIAMILEYQNGGITDKQKEKAEKQKEKQENAVFNRSVARMNQDGIAGLNFAIIGNTKTFTSRSELKAFIESKGGKLQSAISSKTDYLIMNDSNSDIEKKKKAETLGIGIITEAQFNDKSGWAFVIEDGKLTKYRGAGGDLLIPDSVTTIGGGAFWGCRSLTTVTIPVGVITIGNYAFSDCKDLTSVTMHSSVTSIGEKTFSGCKILTIHAPAGSYAETYAKENNIPFVAE